MYFSKLLLYNIPKEKYVLFTPYIFLDNQRTGKWSNSNTGLPGGAVVPGGAVLAVPPETLGSSPGSVAAGRDREVHGATHNWPSVIRVREGLAGRDILVSSRTSDSCGRPGAVRANQVARCTVFPPTHWCGSPIFMVSNC